MVSSTKKTFLTASIVTAILVIGCCVFFAIIRDKNERASLLSQEIDSRADQEAYIRNAEKTAAEFSGNLEKVDSYFLKRDDIVPFIENLEALGTRNNVEVSISSVDVGSEEEKSAKSSESQKDLQMLMMRIKAKGTWNSVMSFVAQVESLPYKVSIASLSLDAESSASSFSDSSQKAAATEWNTLFEMSVLTI